MKMQDKIVWNNFTNEKDKTVKRQHKGACERSIFVS